MYYTIYKIINNVNGRFYIGMHRTKSLDDGYMGSGKLIKQAISKYGKENFTKIILHIFNNADDMIQKEKELIILGKDSYNLCQGGLGGFDYVNTSGKALRLGAVLSDQTKEKISKAKKGMKHSETSKLKISENNASKRPEVRLRISMALQELKKVNGLKKSDATKKKISMALKNRALLNISNPNKGLIRPKIKCPYCDVAGAKNTMVRFHFDKCKQKDYVVLE